MNPRQSLDDPTAAASQTVTERYGAEPARTTKWRPFGELGECPSYSANYRINSNTVSQLFAQGREGITVTVVKK
jgi:hypothetical protein